MAPADCTREQLSTTSLLNLWGFLRENNICSTANRRSTKDGAEWSILRSLWGKISTPGAPWLTPSAHGSQAVLMRCLLQVLSAPASAILLFVIGLYMIPDLGLTAEAVVPVARPVCKARGTVCIYNSAKPSDVPSRDNDQHGTLSSPSTSRATDLGDEDTMSCDGYTMSNEWSDAPSIPSGIATVPKSYTTVANNSPSTWQPTQHLSHENFSSLFPIPGVPWMPWNPLMDNYSFPWFTEGLEIPLGFQNLPDLMDTSPIVVENAASPATHLATVSAPAIPPPTTIDNHTDPETYINPKHICSSYTKPCLPFPKPQDIGIQMARAELFGHIHDIPQQAIEGLNDFYKTQQREKFTEAIPHDIVHAFVELYFEYFDPQFTFLHPSRVEDPGLSWLILLAVAAVGSHYSAVQGAEEYNLALSNLLARAVEQSLSNRITQVETATVQKTKSY
ncbi:hypothetical protein FPSE5266_00668 [Fusarium pseudograminearum]|nr:hypothetical protein FPSE5266_00668 [Fusarium pseudograminearum]